MHYRKPLVMSAVAVLLGLNGCASARIKRENAAALAGADARVLDGCYDCLLEAQATYERISALGSRPSALGDTARLRLFETKLLLVLREKELGIDTRESMARVRALVPRLPAALDAERVAQMVDAVPPDGTGRGGKWLGEQRRPRAAYIPKIREDTTWLASTPLRPAVRDYIALALQCAWGKRPSMIRMAGSAPPPQLPASAPPLLVYRDATCQQTDTLALARAGAAMRASPEVAYFSGSKLALVAEETGGEDAAKLLDAAYRRFPRSPNIAYMAGWLRDAVGDCPNALRYFDETLAIDSTHEYAQLQRTVCLSHLQRDSAVIESASRLIALEGETLGQAFYWRALSRHRLKDLRAARADAQVAKLRARAGNTLTLAGVIAHDLNDFVAAETDLIAARAEIRGDENCTAAWYLGLTFNKTERPKPAAEMFESAMACHDLKVAYIRWRIGQLQEKTARHPTYVARRIAALAADSAEQRQRYYASAFNAAGNFANAGNLPHALELLDVAAADARLAEPVAKVREAIAAHMPRGPHGRPIPPVRKVPP